MNAVAQSFWDAGRILKRTDWFFFKPSPRICIWGITWHTQRVVPTQLRPPVRLARRSCQTQGLIFEGDRQQAGRAIRRWPTGSRLAFLLWDSVAQPVDESFSSTLWSPHQLADGALLAAARQSGCAGARVSRARLRTLSRRRRLPWREGCWDGFGPKINRTEESDQERQPATAGSDKAVKPAGGSTRGDLESHSAETTELTDFSPSPALPQRGGSPRRLPWVFSARAPDEKQLPSTAHSRKWWASPVKTCARHKTHRTVSASKQYFLLRRDAFTPLNSLFWI